MRSKLIISALTLVLCAGVAFAGDIYVPGEYATIQLAVDNAISGDVIHVAAGTYTEQVHITTGGITIDGAGVGSTVIASPVTLTAFFTTVGTSTNDNYPVVFIDGVTGVALSNLTVDGANQGDTNYRFIGVGFWNGDGSMTDMEVLNVMNSTFSGAQHGVGVYAYNDTGGPYSIAMTDVLVDDYQKTGVALSGDGLTVALLRVETVGQGATSVTAQNGIQIGYGAGGAVDDCTITGNDYTGATWTASGFLPSDGAPLAVDGLTLDNNQTSLYIIEIDGTYNDVTVTNPTGDAFYAFTDSPARGAGDVPAASPFGGEHARGGSRATMTVSFSNSSFTGAGATDSWGPASYAMGNDVDMTITDCTVTGWDWGIVAYEAGGSVTTTVSGCGIYGNTSYGFYTNAVASRATQDIYGNWWGAADGPGGDGPGTGDAVTGAVDYSPWYEAVPGTIPMPYGTDDSIQDAIDAAANGATVNVAAGTYREQLRIDGKSIDLVGAGVGATVLEAVDTGDRTTYSVTQWTGSARTIDACIGVTDAGTVNISDMTVDGRELGPNNFYGVHFFDTSGGVTDCRIEDITDAGHTSYDRVVSLAATHGEDVDSYTVDFSDNVIPSFQKGGILVMGPYITFNVDGNEITNLPSNTIAGNGIQLSYGASGTTEDNIVHGVGYTGDDWSATGILLFESGDVSMDGDLVHACQSAVNFSDWGWVYLNPTTVSLSFTDLLLYDNEWSLGCQLSRDDSDLDFDADGCVILDSTGDGIDLWGTDEDPWGGGYYTGWDNGDLVADITNCVITGTALDGIWIDDLSGNATNTMDVEVHYTAMEGNVSSGLWNGSTHTVDAENCWWGDPTGPTVVPEPPRGNRPAAADPCPFAPYDLPEEGAPRYVEGSSSRAGDGVHGLVDYDPWLGGNIICDPDPEYLTATDPVKTIDVNYTGGGSGRMYGYSVKISWDGSVVSTAPGLVTQGTLLSDIDNTFFFARTTGTNEITVDCAILGDVDGATGPGTMFSIPFTGLAIGTSSVDITVDRVRDKDNNTLTGFYEDDGLLIVDVDDPIVADVEITNSTLLHTDEYVKDGDTAVVTATVTDDDPAFGEGNIKANLTGLGGAASASPDPGSYDGTTATWTISGVTCTPSDGTVTVTVTATDPIGNTDDGSDTIIADNTAPTAVTGFDAAPGNGVCYLTWDDTSGNDIHPYGMVVNIDDVPGEYPQYPWFVANWPSIDSAYPADHSGGSTAYLGAGTSHTDVVGSGRNIYYYQAFARDMALNYGPAASTARDLATNYWLGDVSDVWGSWGYDGAVDDDDILKLSDSYGTANPVAYPGDAECDVGPTVHPNWNRLGLPKPDDKVEFEDLMVFAMNYGVVTPRVVPFLPEIYDGSPLAVTLESDGTNTSVALRLEGNSGEVKGVSAEISYDPSELEFVSARLTDDMLAPIGEVFFWYGESQGRVSVDVAVLGTGVTIGGSGELATLEFRPLAEEFDIEVDSARLRDVENGELQAKLGSYASNTETPMFYRLVQNAPNPFNPKTTVAYNVPRESDVSIRVYDVAGRCVRTLVDREVEAGRHSVVWDGLNDSGDAVGSGIYFCTMEAPDFHQTTKMTLLK